MASGLLIRNALASDRAAMIELTRDAWEGDDYVPFVWDRWLADSTGWLMAAVLDGRLVGLQHIDRQPDGSAWVEGIRVAAEVQNQGIGGAMLARAISWAQEHGSPWLRLATSSDNPASNRIAQRSGLSVLGRFASVSAAADGGGSREVRIAASTEWEHVWCLLTRTLGGDPGSWVYTEGWSAYSLTPERLHLLLAMGCVLVSEGEPKAVAIATSNVMRPSLRLGLLAGDPEGMTAIARYLRGKSAETGLAVVRANAEARDEAVEALAVAGFASQHGHSMLLHGLDLRG
jgi:RimJ/RimL family protein N-acetyltransferase